MNIQKLKTQPKLNPDEYANVDNGELLSSEVADGISISLKKDTGLFSINSEHYVVFDTAAMAYLEKELAKADVSRVYTLGSMLKGDCSVVYQKNNHPHNSGTLPVILNLSQDKFYKLVRRLVAKNVLAYCVCAPSGFTQKIYMLNPFIVRSRKTFNCEILHFFRDITKDTPKQATESPE